VTQRPDDLRGFARRVIAWQRRHGRHDLPWQGTRDAYRIWLSEVMLQQTQVATVLDYYARFLQRFPDVRSLADASLDEVLACWSGLGYYHRARHLHECARVVVDVHGGVFPRGAEALATLPGIGRSTAAAIAVFASGERVAILDGNVKRVLARVLALDVDPGRAASLRQLWQHAERLLPTRGGIEPYTQGLMDLGATLCRVRAPHCAACPLSVLCGARRAGVPERYPGKARRAARGQRRQAMLWLARGERIWLARRPVRGVWSGLWALPLFESVESLRQVTSTWPGTGAALAPIDHTLTHLDWRLEPWRHRLPSRLSARAGAAIESALAPGRWFTRDEALALGLPAPIRKLIEAG
jgi:A/G-specific adenine glycosylase